MLKDFGGNVAIIIALLFIGSLAAERLGLRLPNDENARRNGVNMPIGLGFGILGSCLILFGIEYAPGILFDLRHIPIFLAAAFFGGGTGLVAAAVISAMRMIMFQQFDANTWIAAAAVMSCAGVSALLGYLIRRRLYAYVAMNVVGNVILIAVVYGGLPLTPSLVETMIHHIVFSIVAGTLGYMAARYLIRSHRSFLNLTNLTSELRALLFNLNSGVVVEDDERQLKYANQKFCDIFQLEINSDQLTGKSFRQLALEAKELFEEEERYARSVYILTASRVPLLNEEWRLKDGRTLERDYIPILKDGETVGHLWSYRDITHRKQTEEELAESENLHKSIVELSPDPIFIVNDAGEVVLANLKVEESLETTGHGMIGQHVSRFVHEDSYIIVSEHMRSILDKQTSISGIEIKLVRMDGSVIDVEVSASPIRYKRKRAILGIFRDITERKLLVEKTMEANRLLELLSNSDGLTGMANRRRYDDQLNKEWMRSARNGTSLSLIMLDIDCFKMYNDTYGHSEGDTCLKKVAAEIERELKRPGDFAARYGGEEFSVILPETDEEGALRVAESIRAAVEALRIEHRYGVNRDVVTVSLGVATVVAQADDEPKSLLDKADQALYASKRSGRNRAFGYSRIQEIQESRSE